jgi:hypothetical protein
LLFWLMLAPATWAQQEPSIGYVYPAGGQVGSQIEVTVGGQRLASVTNVIISGTGITTTILETPPNIVGKQSQQLRDTLSNLQEKRAAFRRQKPSPQDTAPVTWTTEDDRKLAELTALIAKLDRRRVIPALSDQVVIRVAIAPDAKPSDRELRLVTSAGISNPLVFCVGRLIETRETPSRGADSSYLREARKYGQPGPIEDPAQETKIAIPCLVNGQIQPGDVDRFRFTARKGTRLVAAVDARHLIPYLADAVPGWFQATLALYNPDGKRLAYADDYRSHPDPVLYYELPADGEYVVEIKDAIYRGREDFVYRLRLGELPFITGIHPLGGPADRETVVTLRGVNLPVTTLKLNTHGFTADVLPVSVRGTVADSNPVMFAVDRLPECFEAADHTQIQTAQPLNLPVIVNGLIARPGEWDVYRIVAQAGDTIVAEVTARRLGSPLDSYLRLTDANGTQLAFNDDHEDKATGLNTHHADSLLVATLPSAGAYYLFLGDTQGKAGADYAYRLRVSPSRPDFTLRLVPSGLWVRPGGTVSCTVYALRKDGFTGPINLAVNNPTQGFNLSGGFIRQGEEKTTIKLTAPPAPQDLPYLIQIEGQATIDGHQVSRVAVPADDLMQAFIYRHLVPARTLSIQVRQRPPRSRQ